MTMFQSSFSTHTHTCTGQYCRGVQQSHQSNIPDSVVLKEERRGGISTIFALIHGCLRASVCSATAAAAAAAGGGTISDTSSIPSVSHAQKKRCLSTTVKSSRSFPPTHPSNLFQIFSLSVFPSLLLSAASTSAPLPHLPPYC